LLFWPAPRRPLPAIVPKSGSLPGAARQVGLGYYLGPRWFLDPNDTFAMSGPKRSDASPPFTNANSPLTGEGTANGIASQQVTSQAFTVTLNKLF
jgi:hypothetical protein